MAVVIYIFLLFLSIVGLCEIIHFCSLYFYDIRSNKNKILCCILQNDNADTELRFVIEQYNWLGRKFADKIIAVDTFEKENNVLLRCRELADKYNINIVKPNELKKYFCEES